ncbi:MAG: DUF1320 domain-containing protein [Rhodocyclaceae bacterium]|nr:DUF1320 domain-containing protein [Rhodocyclaceae bacterium]
MSYATPAMLAVRVGAERLIEITDRMGAGAVDAAVAGKALMDAAAEIDGYLAVRYTLPLATVPPMLARLACAIARYRLWEDLASERVRQEYEDARRVLEQLARGQVSLGLPASLPEAQRPGMSLAAAQSGPAPVFSPEQMGGW